MLISLHLQHFGPGLGLEQHQARLQAQRCPAHCAVDRKPIWYSSESGLSQLHSASVSNKLIYVVVFEIVLMSFQLHHGKRHQSVHGIRGWYRSRDHLLHPQEAQPSEVQAKG